MVKMCLTNRIRFNDAERTMSVIAFKIDDLTPCLTDALTGETFQTEVVELKRKSFLSKFNADTGWYVDWSSSYSLGLYSAA